MNQENSNPLRDIRIGTISSRWAEHNGLPCRFEKSTESTNDLAKAEAFREAAADDVKLYLADHQSKGRGRGTNTWSEDRPGAALLSSWSYLVDEAPQPVLTPRVGLALFKAASAAWPFLPFALKAPNDLYVGERKIAGLLLETVTQGDELRLVVGLGLNVLAAPADVPTATSILDVLPEGVPLLGEDWVAFLERLFFELTDAASKPAGPLTTTERASLKFALNQRTGVETVTAVLADGGLEYGDRVLPWTSL